MTKQIKIIIAVFIIVVLGAVGFGIYKNKAVPNDLLGGDRDEHGCIGSAGYSWCEAKNKCLRQWEEKCEPEEITVKGGRLSEAEARAIAEKTCISGDGVLSAGMYNENSKAWRFDATLNAMPQGCDPACVVSEETKTAEISWPCMGIVLPAELTQNAIKEIFIKKYPKYAGTLSVNIEKETENHVRGGIIFEPGAPGGIFLAANINGEWQILHEGNGEIPCSLLKYGFPNEMLTDCAEQ